MKLSYSITLIILSLVINTRVIRSQSVDLNQIELMKNTFGTWRSVSGKDTVEYWDHQQYGEGYIVNAYLNVKGQTIPQHINIYSFDPKNERFKGFMLWQRGAFATWIGSFTSKKIFHVDFVTDYNPDKKWGSFDMIFADSTSRNHVHFVNGIKTREEVFTKVK